MTHRFHSWVLHLKKMKTPVEKDICMSVFVAASFSQDMEATHVPINRWMDEDVVWVCVYIDNGIYMYMYMYTHPFNWILLIL